MKSDALQDKFSAARARLILDKPFLGALVLRLPTQPADPAWCPTTATDMRCIHFNPEYAAALGTRQLEFILAHEALHCALSHLTRRGHRDKRRWDLACDLAINPLLVADGLVPPANAVTFLEYAGMAAEEIYPLLDENTDDSAMDQHLENSDEASGDEAGGGAGGRSANLGPDASDELSRQWQQHLAAAAQRARQAGKLGAEMMRLIHGLLEPKLSWRALLAERMRQSGREDYSYVRPSRRESEAILPGLHGPAICVPCVIDVSGSIRDNELREFLTEIEALKAQVNARIILIECDREIIGNPLTFEPWDELSIPTRLLRGGGTDFRPPFDWLERHAVVPELLVYFTDAHGEFPERAPPYPVTWLVKGGRSTPWGRRIQLN